MSNIYDVYDKWEWVSNVYKVYDEWELGPLSDYYMDYCVRILALALAIPKEWVIDNIWEAPKEIIEFLKEAKLILEKVKEEME